MRGSHPQWQGDAWGCSQRSSVEYSETTALSAGGFSYAIWSPLKPPEGAGHIVEGSKVSDVIPNHRAGLGCHGSVTRTPALAVQADVPAAPVLLADPIDDGARIRLLLCLILVVVEALAVPCTGAAT